ncbi:putative alpha protein [Venustampulla echinocandica]|uniref:Putative alpha protein n=1 Tax=Venustampulla echinocandica TaxID=2656787 RepID=A0A370TB07_9HELO|nr:putative alpha protein [Venustampulla echinocandica]RDL31123.1 putative alpha protein [Venustampulla echinocandica]
MDENALLRFLKFVLLSSCVQFIAAQNTSSSWNTTSFDPLKYVNPLIGTDNGGNVFAGATLPYGMAKAVADVDGQNTAGFSTDGSNITGFSHMHDSGTGGNPSLGNFPLFPQYCPEDEVNNCNFVIGERKTKYINDSVVATPGYFSLNLETGIKAEMTVTEHAALYHFNFPPKSSKNGTDLSPLILLDLTDLSASRQNASVSVDENGRIRGNGTFLPSFGSGSFILHFCADFLGAKVKDTGIWVNNRAGTEPKTIFVTRGINLFYLEAGSWIQFERPADGVVSARVGVSFITADKACQNAETEIPGDEWDFAGIKKSAEEAWREKLSVVRIDSKGVSENLVTNFYSAMYRTMMSPQNYTGENPLWESEEPYYDSFYCLWDAFRSQLPFLTIIDPTSLTAMIRSLLDTYVHIGWLPDCRMSLCKGFTQGGSNADVVLADAFVKNLTSSSPSSRINWDLAYEAVLNDAENEPLDWSVEGRGGLMSWKALDYIPYLDYDYLGFGTNSRSISRTLEYSYDDFCVATIAKGLGKEEGYKKYMRRAMNWRNLWKEGHKSYIQGNDTGFTGFFQPKYLNGTWGEQDPIKCSPLDSFCSLTSNPQETFEDSIWEYQFYVPHAVSQLITLLGGPNTFISRLQFLHTSGLTDIGNEPSFLTAFLYHYAGRPGLSSELVHQYVPGYFNDTVTGLPGNDDTGAMASFSAFISIGVFPNPGQNIYFLTAPLFPSISITSPVTGKMATITTSNFDPEGKRIYIQSVKYNGKVYEKSWIGHELFTEGGVLEFEVGDVESERWGRERESLPPSL